MHCCVMACDATGTRGVWDAHTAAGASIRGALDWQLKYVGPGAPPWPEQQIDPFASNCTISMVTQCEGGYFPLLRVAARVWQNATYAQRATSLPAVNATTDPLGLLFPAPAIVRVR